MPLLDDLTTSSVFWFGLLLFCGDSTLVSSADSPGGFSFVTTAPITFFPQSDFLKDAKILPDVVLLIRAGVV